MRIRVFLPKLKECDEELFQETRKILGLMDDVDSVISGLRSLSGMGAVIGVIQRSKDKMQEQFTSMIMMEQGLEQIQMLLMDEENRMIDRAEQPTGIAITQAGNIGYYSGVRSMKNYHPMKNAADAYAKKQGINWKLV